MKMEVIAVQQQYQTQYGVYGSNKVKDWTSPLMTPTQSAHRAAAASLPYLQSNTTNKIKNSITKKSKRTHAVEAAAAVSSKSPRATSVAAAAPATPTTNNTTTSSSTPENLFYCDDIDSVAVSELSARLLDELRAAKSRHLTCTEVSLPCDLTPRIAAEIVRVSAKEPCGIRGCTIYIEFEDEPQNSRRIASLQLDPEMVSTFEVYLTLRQDHRGWTALLPQFMKNLARTITISPDFAITKHKLYSPQRRSYTFGGSGSSSSSSSGRGSSAAVSAAIATPTS